MTYQIQDRPGPSCLPPRRSRETPPTIITPDMASAMLTRARANLSIEVELGPRGNPMMRDRWESEVAEIEQALDEWKAALADLEQTTLETVRRELSQLHPDHGGPGGEQFMKAVRRMKRAKKSTGDQPHAA